MSDRPTDIRSYVKWLRDVHGVPIDPATRNYYDVATRAMRDHLGRSKFWQDLVTQLPEYDAQYLSKCSVYLLMSPTQPLEAKIKPFDSVLDKSFRKNVLENGGFPQAPDLGWIFPSNWLLRLNDIVRTSIAVKYLDGVTFLVERVGDLANATGVSAQIDYEAREEGYYAAHVCALLPAEIPNAKWDTERIEFSLEVQITTQMQEAIRVLTHPFYTQRRSAAPDPRHKWQWDYASDEFRANYLAHTLHHIEGLIMDIRARGGKKDDEP